MSRKPNVIKVNEYLHPIIIPSQDIIPIEELDQQDELDNLCEKVISVDTLEEEMETEEKINFLEEKFNSSRDVGFGIVEGSKILNHNRDYEGSEGYLFQ